MIDKGFDCVGATMKLFENEDAGIPRSHTCCSLDDVSDARQVATRLGMNYYVFNFKEGFKENVIDRFTLKKTLSTGLLPRILTALRLTLVSIATDI